MFQFWVDLVHYCSMATYPMAMHVYVVLLLFASPSNFQSSVLGGVLLCARQHDMPGWDMSAVCVCMRLVYQCAQRP